MMGAVYAIACESTLKRRVQKLYNDIWHANIRPHWGDIY